MYGNLRSNNSTNRRHEVNPRVALSYTRNINFIFENPPKVDQSHRASIIVHAQCTILIFLFLSFVKTLNNLEHSFMVMQVIERMSVNNSWA